jgi:hypothetical protein
VNRAAVLLAAVATLALLSGGCASALRQRTTPFPTGTRQVVPWELNRELLIPVNKRIQFVVDVEQGHPPERAALDDLVKLAARYGERPASWAMRGAPETVGTLDPDVSYVFVSYVGWKMPNFGLSWDEERGGRTVYFIWVNQEKHRRWRSLVLPERRLEEQTLIHEYGHLLGLPPADHGYWQFYPRFIFGAHCVNPDCALTKPTAKSIFYGLFHTAFGRHFLEDYCAQCRAAIAAAKLYWRGPST